MKSRLIKEILNRPATIDLFPLRRTLRTYSREKALADFKAGISVAMLSFSMSIAYAMVAGLPLHYGLFGCIIAAFVSGVFSSSRYIMFGPSNASAIMLMSAFASLGIASPEQRIEAAAAIIVLVGLFLILASILKITNFIRYVSKTVVTAYITVGAIIIIAKQGANLLGLPSESSPRLFETIKSLANYLPDAKFDALGVALGTFVIYYACKRFFKKLPAQAVALVLTAILYALLKDLLDMDVSYISSISVSDWKFTPPDFGIAPFRDLTFASVAVAIFCVIEATSIGKSLAAKNADRLKTNQEVFSLGIANVAAGLFSGTVESGSMTRSAAGADAGTKTTIVNFFSGAFMLVGVLIFGRLVGYIPLPAIAAVIVAIAIPLFSRSAIRLAVRSTRADAVVFFLTFLTGIIWSLDDAIYVGVAASIVLFLKKASTPEVVEVAIGDNGEERRLEHKSRRHIPEISIVHVGGNLFFGASDVFQNQIRRICEEPNLKIILLKLRNAINFDGTSASDLGEIAQQMQKRGGVLYVCEASPEIMAVLKKSGIAKVIGEENIFPYTEENPTLSAALALRAAKKYLGNRDSDVKIYV